MMKTILYIHGYRSNSGARKAGELKEMFPDCRVLVPDFEYNHYTAQEIGAQIREIVEKNNVDMLVGSSLGGFFALCATEWFEGPVWGINPAIHPVEQFNKHIVPKLMKRSPQLMPIAKKNLESYQKCEDEVFAKLPKRDHQINLALSTDDDTLGDHKETIAAFPNADQVVWQDNSGHHCTRFPELKEQMQKSLDRIA
ncbi:MAG: hypothetical protein J5526_02975 [Bacteroidales bacterium]|nr:hypothetical protein [Bacteroidales bacterium]